MKTNKKNLKSRRRLSRGAALVEAALVLPVMLSFLGLTMFAHRGYADKIDIQATTRGEVLFYASHNCEGTPPSNITKQGDAADTTDGNGGVVDQTSPKLPSNVSGGVERSWQLTKSTRSQTTASTKVVFWKQSYMYNRPVHADSEVACNEKRFDNDWTAIFGFIKSFAQSGGGFIN